MGRDSAVGIATRYGLDGREMESRWGGEIFYIPPDRPWGPLSIQYKAYCVRKEKREERKPIRCNNIDDLLSIVDVDY